jgi:hypothetical protein
LGGQVLCGGEHPRVADQQRRHRGAPPQQTDADAPVRPTVRMAGGVALKGASRLLVVGYTWRRRSRSTVLAAVASHAPRADVHHLEPRVK